MTLNQDQRQQLIELAIQTRQWSYSPYSHYAVGAALLAESGKIYTGTNIENAAYPNSICAERVAICKAASEGERKFTAIAVASENGGSPCGMCRQTMAEFGVETQVLVVDSQGKVYLDVTVEELLPNAFTPEDLI